MDGEEEGDLEQDPYGQEDYEEGEKVMDDPYYNEYAVAYQEQF